MLHKIRPLFFAVKRKERDGTLKRKSYLSEASSFSLVKSPTGVGKKMQTANFLFVSFFFCSGKRKMKNQQQNKEKSKKTGQKTTFFIFF